MHEADQISLCSKCGFRTITIVYLLHVQGTQVRVKDIITASKIMKKVTKEDLKAMPVYPVGSAILHCPYASSHFK